MLSNTRGYSRHSAALKSMKDAATLQCALCPALRMKGRCKAHEAEQRFRTKIAAAKEKELHRSATELYPLQKEMLDDQQGTADAPKITPQIAIGNIVEELKKDNSYLQWNLEAEVMEMMTLSGIRPCRYSHQSQLLVALRPVRTSMKSIGSSELGAKGKLEVIHRTPSEQRLMAERKRVFASMTPLQRCVVCLLWQRGFVVPQKIICDVRRQMESVEDDSYGSDDERTADSKFQSEENRRVSVMSCQLSIGAVDLSSLPLVTAYIARNPDDLVIHKETLLHFTDGDAGEGKNQSHRPRRTVFFPSNWTEKHVNLSTPQHAHEVVGAIVWTLHMMGKERKLQSLQQPGEHNDACGQKELEAPLRSLTLRRCSITNADALVAALRKQKLETTLVALDLSDNRLMCLRFLFALRSYFAERLLRLSLVDNPITRKPDYREQIRKSLPKLTSLDGVSIRRPPLKLPHPAVLPYAFAAVNSAQLNGCNSMSSSELDQVMDAVARFFYIWETRRIPWTALEMENIRQQQSGVEGERRKSKRQRDGSIASRVSPENNERKLRVPPEEELDDDNFHHRYLHPLSTFSMSVHEGLMFFSPDVMRLETEVEMDESFTGMRLSSLDLSEVRVFDVSMKNNSRNMLHGQSVLHRHARGSLGCYTAYKCSLYPPSLTVSHHFKGAVVSVSKIVGQTIERDPLPPQQQRKGKDKGKATRQKFPGKACAAASFSNTTYKPTFYVVTIHGVMTWRAPSMRRYECIRAAYDRVITLVENAVCAYNSVEASRSAPLLVYNDQLYLRPQRTDNIRSFACYVAPTPEHVARLVVEFGLEACPDGVKLVHAVAERSSSNASTIAALRRLVFGELEDDIHNDTTSGGATVIDCNSYKNNSGDSTDIANSVAPESDDVGAVGVDQALVYFDIYSLLTAETSVAAASDGSAVECPPHRVTLEDVDAVVAATNDRYTSTFKAGVGR